MNREEQSGIAACTQKRRIIGMLDMMIGSNGESSRAHDRARQRGKACKSYNRMVARAGTLGEALKEAPQDAKDYFRNSPCHDNSDMAIETLLPGLVEPNPRDSHCDPGVPSKDEEMEAGELGRKRPKTGLTFGLPRRTEPSMTKDFGHAIDLCDGLILAPGSHLKKTEGTRQKEWFGILRPSSSRAVGGNDVD